MPSAALQLVRDRAADYRESEARLRKGHMSMWESASIMGGVAEVLERLAGDIEELENE